MTAVALPPVWLIALRRSVGPWALVVLVAAELVNATARDRVWSIEWQWTAYWSNTSTYLVAPIAAAVAAAESVHHRRRGADVLLRAGRGLARGHSARVAALAVWVLAAHLVGVFACGASAAWVHHSWHLPWSPTLPAFAAVLAGVVVGAALGWWWWSLAAPGLIAIVGVGLLTVVALGPLDLYLRVDNATIGLFGLQTRTAFTVAVTGWWLAVSLAAGWLLVRRGRVQWSDSAVALTALLAGVALHVEGARQFGQSQGLGPQTCSTTRPVLCVNRDYQPRLGAHARALSSLAAPLAALDPGAVPARFEQAGPRLAGSPPVAGVGTVSVTPAGPVDVTNLALDLVKTASGCASAPTRGSGAFWRGEVELTHWLLVTAGMPDDLGLTDARIVSADQAGSVLRSIRADC